MVLVCNQLQKNMVSDTLIQELTKWLIEHNTGACTEDNLPTIVSDHDDTRFKFTWKRGRCYRAKKNIIHKYATLYLETLNTSSGSVSVGSLSVSERIKL